RAAPDGRPVPRRGSRRACAERRARVDDAFSDRACERRKAFWRPRADSSPRARGGAGPLAPALGTGGKRRGAVRPDRRRARHRQTAPRGGVSLKARRGAATLRRMVFVATVAEYAGAPDRRMGTPAVRRG